MKQKNKTFDKHTIDSKITHKKTPPLKKKTPQIRKKKKS